MRLLDWFHLNTITISLDTYHRLLLDAAELRMQNKQFQDAIKELQEQNSKLTEENIKLQAAKQATSNATLDEMARRLHLTPNVARMVDWDRLGFQFEGKR